MRLSVAVVSPPGYPHSAAFAEVAETIRHGLTTLGHDALVSRDLAAADRRHIVLGAHLAPGAGIQLPPGSIIYNLEQVDDRSRWMTGALLDLYRRYPLWDYSATNIERLVALGVPRPTHVPIGYVPSLTRIAPAEPDIDVLFYGSLNERRKRVIDRLRAAGVRVEAVFGVYGGERDALIARAKLVLNVHYYEAKVFEVVRVSYLLANGRAVVSERGSDPAEEASFASAVAFADHDQLVDTCLALLQQPAERQRLGEAGLGLMRARPEDQFLAPALRALGEADDGRLRSNTPRPTVQPSGAPAPAPADKGLSDYHRAARPEVVELVSPAGKRILDVGCAAGFMGAAMLQKGASEVVGLELYAPAVTAARARLTAVYRVDLATLPALPYPRGYFDCITFADVLEHLPDPQAVLRHLLPYLAQGGTVAVSLPNVRHHSVVLPLVVQGRWDYDDAGVLDRTHLRFFTRTAMLDFLAEVGLRPLTTPRPVRTQPTPALQRLADWVNAEGGAGDDLLEEGTTVQYLFLTGPNSPQKLSPRAPDISSQWAGSRPVRVLLAPALDHPADRHEQALGELVRGMGKMPSVTIGIAVPAPALEDIPPSLQRAAAGGQADLLLTQAPADEAGWRRLLAGASLLVLTSPNPDLERLARQLGVEMAGA